MLLGNFKRGKDKKKRKSREDWKYSSTPTAIGQRKLNHKTVPKGVYSTRASSITGMARPTVLGGIIGAGWGALGANTGARISGNPNVGKATLLGTGIGATLGSGYMVIKGLQIQRNNPYSALYKPKKEDNY